MIKAERKSKVHKGINTEISTEVVIDGDYTDIFFEFMSVLDAMKNDCPDLFRMALAKHMEERRHDN